MKTQKEIGKVHLKIDGLDVERFEKLINGHYVNQGKSIESELRDNYCFIENWIKESGNVLWINTPNLDAGSKLITIDELDDLINGKTKRTKEVIESEIKVLQEELEELDKIKVGDVVVTPRNTIGVVINIDNSTVPYEVMGAGWFKVVNKIDTNLTVKEALGL